jgi:hypothetical protein
MKAAGGFVLLHLSAKWTPFFLSHPETGMGYVIATVILKNGQRFDRVCVVGGTILTVDNQSNVPFTEDQIAEFVVTHDKSGMRHESRPQSTLP